MGNPHRVLPDSALPCSEYEESMLSGVAVEDCQATIDGFVEESVVDLFSFCGCNGFSAPELCDFCPGSTVAYGGATAFGTACDNLEAIAPFVVDYDYCVGTIQLLSDFCPCETIVNDERDAPCSICPNGGEMELPDRYVPFGGLDRTCKETESMLAVYDAEECEAFQKEIPLDVASWCGCIGVNRPESCTLCTEKSMIDNADIKIPDLAGLTCSDIAEIAPYVKDNSVCDDFVHALTGECCRMAGDPTEPPIFVLNLPEARAVSAAVRNFHFVLLSFTIHNVYALIL